MPSVEQTKLKRAGIGLRACDSESACPGFTLLVSVNGNGEVHLLDLWGEVVHSWEMPYPPGLYGYLTEMGTLLYNGKVPDNSGRFISGMGWKGGAVLEADWSGRVLWEVRHPDHHHDAVRLSNGNVLLLCLAEIPRELGHEVRGGLSGTERDGSMWADYLVEMTTDGEVVWEWCSWEHLDPENDGITASQEQRMIWTHGNGVAELPGGNLVVSFRNISTVAILDRQTGSIIRKLKPPLLAQQHAPVPLQNGNLLIFDNGPHRVDHPLPFSRVIEVDLATEEVVWSYQERNPSDFFSPYMSNAQRLPNGNTLICEGAFGRIFEVEGSGRVVWEFVNPYFFTPPEQPSSTPSNALFRAFRYSAELVARAQGAT